MRPVLVLIPGMLCDAKLFAPLVAALGDEVDCRIVDHTGLDSIEAMADRAIAAAKGQPFVIAGLSMGGIAAMEVVRQKPDGLQGVILTATNHRGPTDGFKVIRQEQMVRARQGELRRIIVDEMKVMYLGPHHHGNQALLDLIVTMAMNAGVEAFINQSNALMNRRDYTETLQACALPTLILCGSADELCPPKYHASMAALIKDCQLVELAETGHLVTLEATAQSAEAIANFLRAQR
jgi:pimeloyl-ACP methyl ester carboxylesterase